MRYWYLIVSVMVVSGLTGCGSTSSDSEKIGLESARDSNSRPVNTTAEDVGAADEMTAEQLNLEDTLVYTTELGLYLWDLDQTEPEKIDLRVDPNRVYIDPLQDYLVVGSADDSSFQLYKIDVATHQSTAIVQLSNFSFFPRWSIQSWSPDGEWILINAANVGAPLGFVKVDGSLESAIKIADDWRPTYWTTDNKLVLIETEDQFRTAEHRFLQIEGIKLLEPASDEIEDLTTQIDLDFLNGAQDRNEQYDRLVDTLDEFDIRFAVAPSETSSTRVAIQRANPESETNLYCSTWRIGEWAASQGFADEPTRILHEFENTALLTQFNQLVDGSVLFIRGWYPDCQYGTPKGELIHMQTDGTYEVLTEHIISAGDASAFNGYLDSIRYLVAPNSEAIIWIHQGENGVPEEQALYVTDFASGITAPLLIGDESIHSIEEILWIEG